MSQHKGTAILGIFVADLAFRSGRLPQVGETIDARADQTVPVLVDTDRIHLFDKVGGQAL